MSDDKYILSSLSNALRIMDLLSEKEGLGLAEICSELELGKSSVFRLLYTLEANGFIVKNHDAKYYLSRKFIYYGEIVTARQDDFSLARPELETLSDKVKETVHMSILLSNMNIMFGFDEDEGIGFLPQYV